MKVEIDEEIARRPARESNEGVSEMRRSANANASGADGSGSWKLLGLCPRDVRRLSRVLVEMPYGVPYRDGENFSH